MDKDQFVFVILEYDAYDECGCPRVVGVFPDPSLAKEAATASFLLGPDHVWENFHDELWTSSAPRVDVVRARVGEIMRGGI